MPAGMDDEYMYVKKQSPFLLVADESVCDHADFGELKHQFHGINMKLMKAGGYINGLRLLNEAVKHNMHTMVGCMIETSLGISSAMNLCAGVEFVDLDGFMIVKDEPFGLIRETNGTLERI
jgi:L-Ala-D/L-Glu epimerase